MNAELAIKSIRQQHKGPLKLVVAGKGIAMELAAALQVPQYNLRDYLPEESDHEQRLRMGLANLIGEMTHSGGWVVESGGESGPEVKEFLQPHFLVDSVAVIKA